MIEGNTRKISTGIHEEKSPSSWNYFRDFSKDFAISSSSNSSRDFFMDSSRNFSMNTYEDSSWQSSRNSYGNLPRDACWNSSRIYSRNSSREFSRIPLGVPLGILSGISLKIHAAFPHRPLEVIDGVPPAIPAEMLLPFFHKFYHKLIKRFFPGMLSRKSLGILFFFRNASGNPLDIHLGISAGIAPGIGIHQ